LQKITKATMTDSYCYEFHWKEKNLTLRSPQLGGETWIRILFEQIIQFPLTLPSPPPGRGRGEGVRGEFVQNVPGGWTSFEEEGISLVTDR
jgi:hypothetical protein